MHFPVRNHPSKTFPADQDAFLRPKSSLQNISYKLGCIPPPKIIPARHFLRIRMHSTAPKSSPPKHSRQSGCILSMKSISRREFCRIEMLLLRKANLWLMHSANPSSRILSHRDIAIVQKIHTSTFYLIKCQCMDIFVVLTS